MSIINLLFSFKGRISRKPFWLFLLAGNALTALPVIFYFGTNTEAGESFVNIVAIILLWPMLAVQTKRWHDRNKSAWWLLINLIPIIGFFWFLIENGFLKGTNGPNRFGPDPLTLEDEVLGA